MSQVQVEGSDLDRVFWSVYDQNERECSHANMTSGCHLSVRLKLDAQSGDEQFDG